MSLKRSAAKAGNPQKASHEIQLSGFAAVSDVNGLSNSYYAAGIKSSPLSLASLSTKHLLPHQPSTFHPFRS